MTADDPFIKSSKKNVFFAYVKRTIFFRTMASVHFHGPAHVKARRRFRNWRTTGGARKGTGERSPRRTSKQSKPHISGESNQRSNGAKLKKKGKDLLVGEETGVPPMAAGRFN